MSPELFILLFLAVGALGGGAFMWYFGEHRTIVRGMRRVPLRSVATVPEGELGRFEGVIEAAEQTLEAPLTGRACIAWTLVVRVEHGAGKERRWRKVVDASQSVPFLLRHDAGVALVEVREADELAIVTDGSSQSGLLSGMSAHQAEILKRFGVDAEIALGIPRAIEYREGALVVGEPVAVVGVVRVEHDPRSSAVSDYRGRAARRVICAKAGAVLRLSDDPDARAP